MDSLAEAVDYDRMDHSQVNRAFADDFLALAAELFAVAGPPAVLDVGTGTAQIPIEICRRRQGLKITAIDLASHMLQLGQRNVIREGLTAEIKLAEIDAKSLPYADGSFDAAISNSILHHIPEPRDAFLEMVRVLRPGGVLFVRDLLRPPDLGALEQIVAAYAGEANDHQRQMFRDSLHAALTLEEVGELLAAASLPADWAKQTSDRHWTIAGRLE
ncbi:MAG TPA: class I SAM-dependent methyltransferase [Planctomycetaceae bacterium]|nr:class I SAM-dependent methyltransferase [Planctomycetaceae bacterium]